MSHEVAQAGLSDDLGGERVVERCWKLKEGGGRRILFLRAVERSLKSYCRLKGLDPSRVVCAVVLDFLRSRAVNKADLGAMLVTALEQAETAWNRRKNHDSLHAVSRWASESGTASSRTVAGDVQEEA